MAETTSELTPGDNLAELPDDAVEMSRRQWFYRRKAAFLALYAAILLLFWVAFFAYFKDGVDGFSKVEMFLTTGLASLFTLTGAYMGLATLGDIKGSPRG